MKSSKKGGGDTHDMCRVSPVLGWIREHRVHAGVILSGYFCTAAHEKREKKDIPPNETGKSAQARNIPVPYPPCYADVRDHCSKRPFSGLYKCLPVSGTISCHPGLFFPFGICTAEIRNREKSSDDPFPSANTSYPYTTQVPETAHWDFLPGCVRQGPQMGSSPYWSIQETEGPLPLSSRISSGRNETRYCMQYAIRTE